MYSYHLFIPLFIETVLIESPATPAAINSAQRRSSTIYASTREISSPRICPISDLNAHYWLVHSRWPGEAVNGVEQRQPRGDTRELHCNGLPVALYDGKQWLNVICGLYMKCTYCHGIWDEITAQVTREGMKAGASANPQNTRTKGNWTRIDHRRGRTCNLLITQS